METCSEMKHSCCLHGCCANRADHYGVVSYRLAMGTMIWGDISAAVKYHLVSAYVHAQMILCSSEDHWKINVHFVSVLMKSNFWQ